MRYVIIRMPNTVDMSIYRNLDGLSGQDLKIYNMLQDIGATWVENQMPGTKIWANKKLVLFRITADYPSLQGEIASNSGGWTILRVRYIPKHIMVDNNGDPILDDDDNTQYEVSHDLKNNAMDAIIKQYINPRIDDDPNTGIMRLAYHDNPDERDFPETVDFN